MYKRQLFDLEDYSAQNYICQLVDSIHLYGAKATGYLMSDPGWMYEDGKVPPLADGSMPMPPLPGMGDRDVYKRQPVHSLGGVNIVRRNVKPGVRRWWK